MQDNCVVKQRRCSRIELDGETHEFSTANKNHKKADEIYTKLDTPNMCCVLVDLDEKGNKKSLLGDEIWLINSKYLFHNWIKIIKCKMQILFCNQ